MVALEIVCTVALVALVDLDLSAGGTNKAHACSYAEVNGLVTLAADVTSSSISQRNHSPQSISLCE